MADSGGADGIRRIRTLEKEDRLSALPDSLIYQILSFLPSTKQAIQTGVLSKRWHNQWRFVSNLLLDFTDMPLPTSTIPGIIDRTLFLHQLPKIQKFLIITDRFYMREYDPNSEEMIRFIVRKQAEELILKFHRRQYFRLSTFFFDQPCLVKLQLSGCSIMPTETVNWKSLKDLSMERCGCTDEVIRSMVSGSPLLQSLEVNFCFRETSKERFSLDRLVVASESLRRIVVCAMDSHGQIDISCPNLVEFYGDSERGGEGFSWSDKVLEKFLSDSPLLESLVLKNFWFSNVRVASNVLKKLVFQNYISHELQISCPQLEELDLSWYIGPKILMNLPSSVCAALDLVYDELWLRGTGPEKILEQLQHLDELKFRDGFLEALSTLEMGGKSHPLLKVKSLTLEDSASDHIFAHIRGIDYALRSSPLLETLVVKLHPFKEEEEGLVDLSKLDQFGGNYWNSNETHFSSLLSHLRTVEITGLSQREVKPNLVLDFIDFLLKNAIVLEKMVVMLEDCGTDFVIDVSQKILSFPRCSSAVVELVCPK